MKEFIGLCFLLILFSSILPVFATDGFVSKIDGKIKITYHRGIESNFGDSIFGTVQNISDKQIDKIIIKTSEFHTRISEHTTMPFISSLRPNESSYFVSELEDSLISCYELSIVSYVEDSSSNSYKGQKHTKIFDDLLIDSFGEMKNGFSVSVKNMDTKSRLIESVIVAFNGKGIVDYSFGGISYPIFPNQTTAFGYYGLPQEYETTYPDNNISYDVIARSVVVDRSDPGPGTKYDNFYPMSEIHRSQSLQEIPFGDKDYNVGTCTGDKVVAEIPETKTPKIPDWVKNNVQWWSSGKLSDTDMINAIGFLVKTNIIQLESSTSTDLKFYTPSTSYPLQYGKSTRVDIVGYVDQYDRGVFLECVLEKPDKYDTDHLRLPVKTDSTFLNSITFESDADIGDYSLSCKYRNEDLGKITFKLEKNMSNDIPEWVKNVALWWSEDKVSEDEFVNSIQFLIKNGIIKVN